MDSSQLSGLRTRVLAGEPLDSRELDALGQATARRPGERAWLVCFTQALINSDRAQQAVVLLNAAAEANPGDFDVLLTRARAAFALGRLEDAEQDLARALAERPADLEALRLHDALTAGRRAPPIGCKSEPGQGSPELLDGAGLFERLLAALDARGVPAELDLRGDTLQVRLAPGRCGQVSLAGLVRACRAAPERTARRLADLAAHLGALGIECGGDHFEEVRGRIYPLLRTVEFLARTGPALHRPADAPGLAWLYAVDEGDFLRPLDPDFAARCAVPLHAIAAAAMENLDRSTQAPARYRLGLGGLVALDGGATDWDLVAWERGDGFDATRPLAPRHHARLQAIHSGPWVMAIPATAFCLLAPVERAEAVAFLGALARAEGGGDGLSPELFCVRAPGRVEPLRAA